MAQIACSTEQYGKNRARSRPNTIVIKCHSLGVVTVHRLPSSQGVLESSLGAEAASRPSGGGGGDSESAAPPEGDFEIDGEEDAATSGEPGDEQVGG